MNTKKELLKELTMNFSSFASSDGDLQQELLYLEKMCESRIYNIKHRKIQIEKKGFFKKKDVIYQIDKKAEKIQEKFYKQLGNKIRSLRHRIEADSRRKANLSYNQRDIDVNDILLLSDDQVILEESVEDCGSLELDIAEINWRG